MKFYLHNIIPVTATIVLSTVLVSLATAQQFNIYNDKDEECPGGFVNCINGMTAEDGSRTCEEACEGRCCVNEDYYLNGILQSTEFGPCDDFTGSVCRDDTSCIGRVACWNANIDKIVRSCNGYQSCGYAAYRSASIERVIDSCRGWNACSNVATYGGRIQSITKSCFQKAACVGVASCSSGAGNNSNNCGISITELASSCDGELACHYALRDNTGDYGIDVIQECCNTDAECKSATEATLANICGLSLDGGQTQSPDTDTVVTPSNDGMGVSTQNAAQDQVIYSNPEFYTLPEGGGKASAPPENHKVTGLLFNVRSKLKDPDEVIHITGFEFHTSAQGNVYYYLYSTEGNYFDTQDGRDDDRGIWDPLAKEEYKISSGLVTGSGDCATTLNGEADDSSTTMAKEDGSAMRSCPLTIVLKEDFIHTSGPTMHSYPLTIQGPNTTRSFYITLSSAWGLIYANPRNVTNSSFIVASNSDLEIYEGVGALTWPLQDDCRYYNPFPMGFIGKIHYKLGRRKTAPSMVTSMSPSTTSLAPKESAGGFIEYANALDGSCLSITPTTKPSPVQTSVPVFSASLWPPQTSMVPTIKDIEIETPATVLQSSLAPSDECPGGFVECVDGWTKDRSQTCQEACGGRCCVGDDWAGKYGPCSRLTGNVCRDDKSCFGVSACSNAHIDVIIGSCIGDTACYFTANEGGSIEKVVDSCHGEYSCSNAATNGGSIKSIINSCYQYGACRFTAYCGRFDPNCGSHIKEILSSCDGVRSCSYAARYGGMISHIHNGCNVEDGCFRAGSGEGNTITSGIEDCCNVEKECGCRPSLSGDDDCKFLQEVLTEATLRETCGSVTEETFAPRPPSQSSPTKNPISVIPSDDSKAPPTETGYDSTVPPTAKPSPAQTMAPTVVVSPDESGYDLIVPPTAKPSPVQTMAPTVVVSPDESGYDLTVPPTAKPSPVQTMAPSFAVSLLLLPTSLIESIDTTSLFGKSSKTKTGKSSKTKVSKVESSSSKAFKSGKKSRKDPMEVQYGQYGTEMMLVSTNVHNGMNGASGASSGRCKVLIFAVFNAAGTLYQLL